MKKGGLGKGLEALFLDNAGNTEHSSSLVKISEIEPNVDQPRKQFDQTALEELADSIREHGILQPLVVRPLSMGGYQLVAGERRWRAARLAGLSEVPVIVRELTDAQVMEIALVENLQREDLNPIEEANGYKRLMDEFQMTQQEVAQRVNKSRPVIANAVRLLSLPSPVQTQVEQGELSAGHARALAALSDEKTILQLAKRSQEEHWTVRDMEQAVKRELSPTGERQTALKLPADSFYTEVQIALEEALGRRVRVKAKKEKGNIEIEFFSKEDLGELVEKLSNEW